MADEEYIFKKDWDGSWKLMKKPDNTSGWLIMIVIIFFIVLFAISIAPLWLALLGFAMNDKKRYYASIASLASLVYFLVDVKNKWITGLLFLGQTNDDGSIASPLMSAEWIKYVYIANAIGAIISIYLLIKAYEAQQQKNQ